MYLPRRGDFQKWSLTEDVSGTMARESFPWDSGLFLASSSSVKAVALSSRRQGAFGFDFPRVRLSRGHPELWRWLCGPLQAGVGGRRKTPLKGVPNP